MWKGKWQFSATAICRITAFGKDEPFDQWQSPGGIGQGSAVGSGRILRMLKVRSAAMAVWFSKSCEGAIKESQSANSKLDPDGRALRLLLVHTTLQSNHKCMKRCKRHWKSTTLSLCTTVYNCVHAAVPAAAMGTNFSADIINKICRPSVCLSLYVHSFFLFPAKKWGELRNAAVRLSVCPCVRVSVCPCVRLSVCPSVRHTLVRFNSL